MGNISKGLALALILVMAISSASLFSLFPKALAQTGTNVTGIINSNTTWTQAGSPYELTGNVLINNGATLTIEPNVAIVLEGRYILVNGTLIANGNSVNSITFQGGEIIFTIYSVGWNAQSLSGSVIENAVINGTQLQLSGSPLIADNIVSNAGVVVNDKSAIYENNSLSDSAITINSGSPTISKNYVTGFKPEGSGVNFFTPITVNNGSPIISYNTITTGLVGIEADRGNPYIIGNNITQCQPDLIVNSGQVERNYFQGIVQIGNVTFDNNTVNDIEVQGFSSPQIVYNNVISLRLSSSTDINAINNWWGSTGQSNISQYIWDYYSDFNLGKVNYIPYSTSPNQEAMPDQNSPISAINPIDSSQPTSTPSPTTIPELTWLAIVPLIVSMLVTAVIVRHRKTRLL